MSLKERSAIQIRELGICILTRRNVPGSNHSPCSLACCMAHWSRTFDTETPSALAVLRAFSQSSHFLKSSGQGISRHPRRRAPRYLESLCGVPS